MSIQVLNTIKSIEAAIVEMNTKTLAAIRTRIDNFGETICQSNADILRRKFWAQARFLELI